MLQNKTNILHFLLPLEVDSNRSVTYINFVVCSFLLCYGPAPLTLQREEIFSITHCVDEPTVLFKTVVFALCRTTGFLHTLIPYSAWVDLVRTCTCASKLGSRA